MTETRVPRNQLLVVGWNNHEIHSVQTSECSASYVTVPKCWKAELETSRKLCVLVRWVFSYNTTDALKGFPHVRFSLWAVAEW